MSSSRYKKCHRSRYATLIKWGHKPERLAAKGIVQWGYWCVVPQISRWSSVPCTHD